MNEILHILDEYGYAVVSAVLSADDAAATAEALQSVPLSGAGTRNLLEYSWCRDLVQRFRADSSLQAVLPPTTVAVQCTLFDKTEDRNWLVALHQDLSIPVEARTDHPSLAGWSQKEGRYFVQAPVGLLDRLLAVRVHIDDCGADNGPLRVVPGSHRHGRLADEAARELRGVLGEVICSVEAGAALLMRPLLLHASSKARAPRRRRVLHFLFGPASLEFGLRWQHAV